MASDRIPRRYKYKHDDDEDAVIVRDKSGKRSLTTVRKSKGRDTGRVTSTRRSEDIDIGGKRRGQGDYKTDYRKSAGPKRFGKKSMDAEIWEREGGAGYSGPPYQA